MPEPPYGIIWNRLKDGNVVPFLGAGASLGGRAGNQAWSPKNPQFLPSGKELAHLLAQESAFPSDEAIDLDDLAKVSSYYTEIAGRPVLRDRLRELMNHEFQHGSVHKFLAEIPSPQVLVVTNYDTLLEQAFREAGKPYDLVVHVADRQDIANAVLWWPHNEQEPIIIAPNELDIDLDRTNVIYKMHGTIVRERQEWDNFVITEEDYIDFLSRMTMQTAVPAIFYPHFRSRNFLFLGYSLRDWNLRVVLKNLSKYFSKRGDMSSNELLPSWSIQLYPSNLECKLWEKRNVTIFDISLDDFVEKLQQQK